jgi:hypothetical protein
LRRNGLFVGYILRDHGEDADGKRVTIDYFAAGAAAGAARKRARPKRSG